MRLHGLQVKFGRPAAIVGLFFVMALGVCVAGCAGRERPQPEAVWLAQTSALLDRSETDSALVLLRRAVETYPRSAAVRRTYGRALRLRGGLLARIESAKQLRFATSLDAESAAGHFELGLTYRDQGFDLYALTELRRALALDSTLGLARLVIGRILLDDLAANPSAENAAYLRDQLAPLRGDAMYGLAALAYAAESYYREEASDSALALLARGIWEHAGDSVAVAMYRLWGLVEYDKERFARADSVFELAQVRADPASRFDYDDVRYLISPRAYAQLDSLAAGARADSVAAIWRLQDPDISTAVNERRVEYRARLAYSDLHFGTARHKVPGRNTRRGEFYTRFGPPTWTEHNSGNADDFDMGVPTEIWAYEGLPEPCTLAVVDEYLNGEYDFPYHDRQPRMFSGEPISVDMPNVYADLIAEHPSRPQELPGEELYARVRWARRRSPNGESRLELFYALAHPSLTFAPYRNRSRTQVNATAVLYGARAEEVARRAESTQFIVTPTLTTNPNLAVIDQVTLDAPPGRYRFVLQLRNEGTPKWGTVRGELVLPEFGDTLALSDIILARDIGEPYGDRRMGKLDYLPAFDLAFPRAGKLYLVYDIYNLALRSDGRNDYEETTILQPLKVSRGFWGELKAIFGGSGDTASVSTTRRIRDPGTDAKREYQLDLSAYPPGAYRYTVVIRDLKAKREVRQSVEFELTE